jgi:hypothetical protein
MKAKDTYFDCWTSPLVDVLDRRKYGLNQKTTILDLNVRTGIVDKDKAILAENLSMSESQDETLIKRFANHIDINIEQLKAESHDCNEKTKYNIFCFGSNQERRCV